MKGMKKSNIKLNLGCGPNGLDGWLNYDWGILALLSKFRLLRRLFFLVKILPKEYDLPWPAIKLVDIRKKFPQADKSVQYVYCSHVLEHFEQWQTFNILKECRRVLTKNGWIRIVVPDIEKLIEIYQKDQKKRSFRPAQRLCRLWWGYDKDSLPTGFWGRTVRTFIRDHKWHYDKKEMEYLLKLAGFSRIKVQRFKKGEVLDLDKLDLLEQKNHSLYIEAST